MNKSQILDHLKKRLSYEKDYTFLVLDMRTTVPSQFTDWRKEE